MTNRPVVAAFIVCLCVSNILAVDTPETLPKPADRQIEFDKDVRPILQARCAECHSQDAQEANLVVASRTSLLRGGESGEPAVVPGKSAQSYLVRLVAGREPDRLMPPEGKPLSAGEIGILRAWIDQGLKMPADDTTGTVTTDHWSFQPLNQLSPPESVDPWSGRPVDAFVLQKLQAAGLSPSSRADRRTLIRRLFLVMHGLPPSPEQIRKFVSDRSPDAWQKLVDDVLKSPRYGERWARHWLDLIRFGESHGFETNRERPNAWHYRDWVIDALNADKRYDRFVREQIAGDALNEPIGTGFLVAGPHDLVKSPDINLTLMQRQDELSDLINTVGTSFLGLTLGCARCHNHKFDPITQRDFYSVQAVFAGVSHGDRSLPVPPDRKEQIASVERDIADLRQKLTEFIPDSSAGFVLLDEATVPTNGGRGVERLVAPNGEGTNPSGAERGFASDPGSNRHMPNISGGRYTWWTNTPNVDVAAYRPLQRGRFRVWVSWGCGHSTHTTDAKFVLDQDGHLDTPDDQSVIATVDQKKFADGTGGVVSKALWSGLYDAGIHSLEPASAILVRGGEHGTAITADVLVLESVPLNLAANAPAPLRPGFRTAVNARHNVEQFAPVEAKYVRFTVLATNASEPCIDELEVFSDGENIALASGGAVATSSGNYPDHPLHKLKHINDGEYGNGRSWISNQSGAGWVQIELPDAATIDRVEWARDRQGKYGDRLATRYRIEAALKPDQWQVVASSDDRLPVGNSKASQPVYQFETAAADRARVGRRWLADLEAKQKERDRLSTVPTIYAGKFSQPGPTHRLYRGDPLAKREEVSPDALEVVGTLGLERNSPEQQRRLKFAEWIANPDNPLTARVIVNRVWQFQFGTGIVATPSDFGLNGVPPSHPELLDWLARDFMENGWSLKHLHRRILLSNTWQQDSRPNPESLQVDASARLLWRFPPRRLEAEAIRDSILAVSGALDLRMGGPGFSGFEVQMENVRHFFPKTTYGPEDWRRMIYMTKVRQEHESVFGAFDCPDASQVTPVRSRSTTPLQALNLLNSSFVLQQSDMLAERIAKESDGSIEKQTALALSLSFGREPSADEIQDAAEFAKAHGLEMLCRAVFNSNEFLFIP